MTHYYNLVLEKLSRTDGLDLTLVVPSQVSKNVGDGVHQTSEGVSFRVLRLRERSFFGSYHSFRGFARLLLREKPDVVIANESYLLLFFLSLPVRVVVKYLGIKLILKTIPFRIPRYDEAPDRLRTPGNPNQKNPGARDGDFLKLMVTHLSQRLKRRTAKFAFNLPDAIAAYIDEAFVVFGSYGVPKERIFIIRNSPDTDMLFHIRQSLATTPPVLPENSHRLIHVGRLVEWKRVDLLLRAFARVKAEFQDAELLVIGTGPEEKALKALSVALEVADNVQFLGGVYDPELLGQYLLSSSIYVLAGMGGLSINDAMCFGLPIICSVCDGTEKILVRDEVNGKYFREGNEDDLFDKIMHLLNNDALRKEMGRRSTEIIRNEVNIHTVINGYMNALYYVTQRGSYGKS
jgi:glycosyltransferase involved in cell wall biosynthesis